MQSCQESVSSKAGEHGTFLLQVRPWPHSHTTINIKEFRMNVGTILLRATSCAWILVSINGMAVAQESPQSRSPTAKLTAVAPAGSTPESRGTAVGSSAASPMLTTDPPTTNAKVLIGCSGWSGWQDTGQTSCRTAIVGGGCGAGKGTYMIQSHSKQCKNGSKTETRVGVPNLHCGC